MLSMLPWFMQDPLKVYLVAQILLLAIFALCFDVLYGYTGLLSLGQSVYFGLGAYSTGLMIRHWSVALGWMIPLSIAVAALVACLFGFLAVRVWAIPSPLRRGWLPG